MSLDPSATEVRRATRRDAPWFDIGDDGYHRVPMDRIDHAIRTVDASRRINRAALSAPAVATNHPDHDDVEANPKNPEAEA